MKARGFCIRGSLRLPGGPVLDVRSRINPTGLLRLLRDVVSRIKPPPSANHAKIVASVPRKIDASWRPLQPPYEGPNNVLKRGPTALLSTSEGLNISPKTFPPGDKYFQGKTRAARPVGVPELRQLHLEGSRLQHGVEFCEDYFYGICCWAKFVCGEVLERRTFRARSGDEKLVGSSAEAALLDLTPSRPFSPRIMKQARRAVHIID